MKRLINLLVIVTVLFSASGILNAQILWRGAKTLKKGSLINMGQYYYMDFTKKYINEDWKDNPNDQLNHGFQFMVGYGITDRWEVMTHLPVAFKSFTKNSGTEQTCNGLCDITLKSRFSILPWTKKNFGLTLTGSMRLGTATHDESVGFLNLGDNSTDFGFGVISSSPWRNGFRGHLKVNYWLNGTVDKNNVEANIGDELKFIAKIDRKLSKKFFMFATYIYYSQFELEVDGKTVDKSDKTRNYFVLGGVYSPMKGLKIRPKFLLPFASENKILFDFKPMLDFWYVFNILK